MRPRAKSRPRLLAATALAAVAAALPACGSDDAAVIRLEIPAGAAELVDAGEDVPGVPQKIEGKLGDTLKIINNDSEVQVVSGFPVGPGQTMTIPLNRTGTYEVECSAHEDRSLTMTVTP